MSTINLRPNKLTLYKRPRSPLWQCRYKLDNGEWYRQSTGTDDQTEAFTRFAVYCSARFEPALAVCCCNQCVMPNSNDI